MSARRSAGKAERGAVKIAAIDRFGQVQIRISDDGKGLSREKILEKAIAKNLISRFEARSLPDEKVWNFIFHQGFSTAEKVTDVSGRGVGMDVVRQALDSLSASIKIQSKAGNGSHFIISLPADSRAIDSVLAEDSGRKYALPLEAILSLERVDEARLQHSDGQVLAFRGNFAARPVEIATWLGDDTVSQGSSSETTDATPRQTKGRWVIWVGSEERPVPILSDRILSSRIRIVRRKVPRMHDNDLKILGYASLPTGEVASVLNPDSNEQDAA